MLKITFLFFFFAVLAETVFGLNCYVSETNTILSTIRHEKRDCVEALGAKLPAISPRAWERIQMRCYTVNVAGKANVQITGCIAKNGCDTMKELLKRDFPLYGINCEECKSDYCNAPPRGSVDDNTIDDY